jgi:hypothetical protein
MAGIVADRWSDGKGWIAHKLRVNVTYAETWKVGEERDCNSEMAGGDLMLACAMYPSEQLSARVWDVTLHGRVTNEEINWMCRRDETSIVCRSTD